jgi:hypothetical protein
MDMECKGCYGIQIIYPGSSLLPGYFFQRVPKVYGCPVASKIYVVEVVSQMFHCLRIHNYAIADPDCPCVNDYECKKMRGLRDRLKKILLQKPNAQYFFYVYYKRKVKDFVRDC